MVARIPSHSNGKLCPCALNSKQESKNPDFDGRAEKGPRKSLYVYHTPVPTACVRPLSNLHLNLSHNSALAPGRRLIGILGLLDLSNKLLKGLGDVLVIASTGLGPGTLKLLTKLLAILGSNLPLFGAQIALVADNDDGDPLDALRVRP